MSSNIVTMRCPACNAPFPEGSSNKLEIKCPYCGQVTYNSFAARQPTDAFNPISVIPPVSTDNQYEEDLIGELVRTDYVPVDVFDTFCIEETRHNMYPVYVFDVNWSANWSAVFSQRVSHEEPTYDYNGKRTGTRTVYETQYRDANGTSAGDCRVTLSGLMEGFPYQSEICVSYSNIDGMDGRVAELLITGQKLAAVKLYKEIYGVGLKEAKEKIDEYSNSRSIEIKPVTAKIEPKDISEVESEKLNGWRLIEPNLSDKEAWEKGGKAVLVNTVEYGVANDLRSMSAGWLVDRSNYTYRYSEGRGQCVLIPIWETDYCYADKEYSAVIDFWEVHWKDYPKDEAVENLQEKTDEEISSYKSSRAVGYVCFGIFAALAILFLALPSFSENRIGFCAMLVLAVVSWALTRNVQRKKLDLENKFKNKLWDDKVKRREAAEKKFGIKVSIGEEPEKQTMEYWVDVMVYILFGIVFFIAIMQGLFEGNKPIRQNISPTSDQSTYHHEPSNTDYSTSESDRSIESWKYKTSKSCKCCIYQ